jgi:hypothetical protein
MTERLFDLGIRGEHSGPWNEDELRERLEAYRRDSPNDQAFSKVTVIEIPEHGTAGTPRSVFDFIDDNPERT